MILQWSLHINHLAKIPPGQVSLEFRSFSAYEEPVSSIYLYLTEKIWCIEKIHCDFSLHQPLFSQSGSPTQYLFSRMPSVSSNFFLHYSKFSISVIKYQLLWLLLCATLSTCNYLGIHADSINSWNFWVLMNGYLTISLNSEEFNSLMIKWKKLTNSPFNEQWAHRDIKYAHLSVSSELIGK